ncbi:MAG: glycosyltransferase family 4 protein [Chthoniobacterales bacterium]|nr:glycosyltransferase family 4 protein [Chthoniobacterales bacterium]
MNQAKARILMMVENHFPQDTRVKNEADLLAGAGYQVAVIALQKGNQRRRELVDGVTVYRIPRLELFNKTSPVRRTGVALLLLKARSALGYLIEYVYFTAACLAVSSYVFVTRGFDVIHAHNPPDTLFLVALPFKLLGKKFVFDHHDLCPELYRSRYGAKEGFATGLLRLLELCSLKLADIAIATNESYKAVQIQRAGKNPQRIFIVRNGPNRMRMAPVAPNPRLREMKKTILCYVGSLNPQDGVDYLLRALRHLLFDLKRSDFHCVIMGAGDSLHDLRRLAQNLQLNGCVELPGFVPDEELQANLAAADICLDPDPSSPLNDVSTWIKVMEYMACAKPIVTFDLKETRFSAQEAAVYVEPNNEREFAKAIAQLMDQPELQRQMGAFGRRRVERELQWAKVGQNLLAAYDALLAPKHAAPAEEPLEKRSTVSTS